MEYTAEKLYEMDVNTLTVIYPNGDCDYFVMVNIKLYEYLFSDHSDDVDILVYPMSHDGNPREDMSGCSMELFLKLVNSGNEIRFNEDRDVTHFY